MFLTITWRKQAESWYTEYSSGSNEKAPVRQGNPMKSRSKQAGFAVSVSTSFLLLYRFVLIRKIAHDFSRCHAAGTCAIRSWNFVPDFPFCRLKTTTTYTRDNGINAFNVERRICHSMARDQFLFLRQLLQIFRSIFRVFLFYLAVRVIFSFLLPI